MVSFVDDWKGRYIRLAVVMLFILWSQATYAGDLADVKARGKLIMLSYPVQGNPFIAVDLEVMRQRGLKLMDLRKADEFKGIDVELMNGFAKSLGVELEIHTNLGGWGALLPSLVHGDGDVAACELTITPQREQIAAFSRPYHSTSLAIAVRP